jgi:hypothetical protein
MARRPDTRRHLARTDVVFRTASGGTVIATAPRPDRLALPTGMLAAGAGRVAYALVGFPLAVAGAGGARRGAARRFLDAPTAGSRPAAVAADLLAFLLTAPLAAVFLLRGVAYPLVTDDATGSWGGPTMAGAWVTHLVLSALLLAAAAALLRPLARRHR